MTPVPTLAEPRLMVPILAEVVIGVGAGAVLPAGAPHVSQYPSTMCPGHPGIWQGPVGLSVGTAPGTPDWLTDVERGTGRGIGVFAGVG